MIDFAFGYLYQRLHLYKIDTVCPHMHIPWTSDVQWGMDVVKARILDE